jgi:hypothetical protein
VNIRQLVADELTKLLTDAQSSELGRGLKSFVDSELENIEARFKDYVDAKFSQLSTVAATATMGKSSSETIPGTGSQSSNG